MNNKGNTKIRIFSGTRPTGFLHLGNYLGGLKGYLDLQNKQNYDCIYAVVDLHGITSPYDSKTYQDKIREVVLEYLACGLDPKKCHLLIQSQVPQHVELAYLLGTLYPVSRLEQLPTYKEKKKEQPHYMNMGLLYYPVLMAADILLYKTQFVPVGKDQGPHLEVTREIARIFNRRFGKTFPEPQIYLTSSSYIPSLTGEGKMSKSKEGSYINLVDDLRTIKIKLARVPTDTGKGKKVPQKGGVAVLLALVEIFEGEEKRKDYEKLYLEKGIQYKSLKEELAIAIYKELKPIQKKRKYFEENPELVNEILEQGRKHASRIAKQTILEVKQKMGIV
ncbi:MAG: tryptophan--tRNA ligase [Candidatus Pacebacteria bacterium]|nr:tryptophan--tRNA ligase [Candidatus Paceibacterota bacterium]